MQPALPPLPSPCWRCDGPREEGDPDPCRRCRADPFPEDTVIRRAGFRIWMRPRTGGVIWWRAWKYYTHKKALLIAVHELRHD